MSGVVIGAGWAAVDMGAETKALSKEREQVSLIILTKTLHLIQRVFASCVV